MLKQNLQQIIFIYFVVFFQYSVCIILQKLNFFKIIFLYVTSVIFDRVALSKV